MELRKLWQNLFLKKTFEEEVALHSAGATVRHKNPFENLEVIRNDDKFTREFANEWISPFYMTLMHDTDYETRLLFAASADKFTLESTKKLLGYFDWRPKITAAYFAAINNHIELEDDIGKLLLKSEVCYAGYGFCLALAIFGTEKSKEYLKTYLNYYLSREDLWFEQSEAFCALELIDKNESDLFVSKWINFVENKPDWNLNSSRIGFLSSVNTLLDIRKLVKHRL